MGGGKIFHSAKPVFPKRTDSPLRNPFPRFLVIGFVKQK